MKILHIETATQICSVALSEDGVLVLAKDMAKANAHASHLTLLIEELLAETGEQLGNLSAISVSKGPGSYTGLRIGVATAKGLCFGADLPLLAVDSLSLMASGFLDHARELGTDLSDVWLMPMIDARRMEVYTAAFDKDLTQVEPIAARIIDEHSFDEELYNGKIMLLFGDGADKFAQLFSTNDRVTVVENFKCAAGHGVHLAYQKLLAKQFEDTAYFDPLYLKDFVPTKPKEKVVSKK